MRQCVRCKEHLAADAFSRRSAKCKPCATANSREWRQANLDRSRKYHASYRQSEYAKSNKRAATLKYRYRLTIEQFDAMADAQHGKCAICVQPFTSTPHVDHCHATGTIRGLLCDRCNRGIGYFDDDPLRLIAAAEYLRKS